METFNFRTTDYTYDYPQEAKGRFIDARNGIACTNPSLDLECYLNYLQLLNDLKDSWKSVGYLHLGMMPVVMAPSFMQRPCTNIICSKLDALDIKYYSLPAVSLLYENCKMSDRDIWVFREDAAKLFNVPNITASDFLRRLLL
ncbi:MAG: hypothetical protein IJE43_19310 [Alphaproteobacteria bacterium]|nr:hypothetical protein [Alphaproteobacteria bacterium]